MNRIIKFRAWGSFGKKMYYQKENLPLFSFLRDVDGMNIMQFTGLRDKNGKGVMVYEGDYFEAIYKDCPDGYSILGKETTVIKIRATVVFKFGQFAVEMMHPEYKQLVHTNLFDFLKNEQKEVIGNIYENPELI
jgi:uncharacterized phage protein (TIGR01671 family)